MATPEAGARLSTRLVQVLRTYCGGLEGGAIRDLRDSVAAGRYPWLRDELYAALRTGAVAPQQWAEYVGHLSDPGGPTMGLRLMRQQQRQVWSVVFPESPYPTAPGIAHTRRKRPATPAP